MAEEHQRLSQFLKRISWLAIGTELRRKEQGQRLNMRWWVTVGWMAGALVLFMLISFYARGLAPILWAGIAFVGSWRGAIVVNEAYKDRRAVKNGAGSVYGRALVRRELVRQSGLLAAVVIGAMSLWGNPSWTGPFIITGLMYLVYTVSFNSTRDSTLRERMQEARRRSRHE